MTTQRLHAFWQSALMAHIKKAAPLVLIPFLFLAQACFTALYVNTEHTFYFWDHSMYHRMAQQLFAAMDYGQAMGYLNQTLASNYPVLYAIPHLLTFSFFDDSRLSFLLTNFVFFLIPQQIAFALILKRGFSFSTEKATLTALVAASLVPPVWVPMLQGYPDNASCVFLMFAFAATLTPARTARKAIGIGLMLGLSILLRRHFAYGAITLIGLTGLFDLWSLRQDRKLSSLLHLVWFYGLCGTSLLLLMRILAPDFLASATSVDYTALYHSYKVEAPIFLQHALNNFGYMLALVSALGLCLLLKARNDLALRTTIWITAWLLVWCLGPAQTDPHYVLQLLPLGSIVGLTGLMIALKQQPKIKQIAASTVMACLLFANSAYCLWFAPEGVVPNYRGEAAFFAAPRPPVVRTDYDELVRLAATIYQKTTATDHVLMVGSSFTLNQDILRAVYTDALEMPHALATQLQAPEVDGVQEPPYDVYAMATMFVVPDPAQYHLDPSGQKVVTALADRFVNPTSDLRPEPEVFTLEKGVKVRLWRRDPVLNPSKLMTDLRAIHDTAAAPNAHAREWVLISPAIQSVATTMPDGHTFAQSIFAQGHDQLTLFQNRLLPTGVYHFSALTQAQPACSDVHFILTTTDKDGKKTGESTFAPDRAPARGAAQLSQTVTMNSEGYVTLTVQVNVQPMQASCMLALQGMNM